METKRAVFFDRDDTIIKNVPYNGDPSKVELLPSASPSLEKLVAAGFDLFIVSNQSGVGRGYITIENVHAVNEEMIRQLGKNFFTHIYNCYGAPGTPDGETRKPSPHMLLEAAKSHHIDLSKSYMVGDRLSDIECGINAGCKSLLLLGAGHKDEDVARQKADFTANSLQKITEWILADASKKI